MVSKKTEVNGELDTRLVALAKKNKVKLAEVKKQYEDQLAVLKERGVTVNLERLAVNGVMNIYRRGKSVFSKPRKEATIMYGFISGDLGIWDKAEQVRRQVKKFIEEKGLQAALEANMVDGDNNILDQRAKIYGRDNPNYLKPLNPKLQVLERTLFGFFRKNGSKVYKYGSIQTSDNRLARAWSKVKFYVPCQVPTIIKEEDDTDYILSSSSAEDTLSVFKAVKEDIDIKKVIDETLVKRWTDIKNIEELHEATKDAWDRKVFVKGVVAWINEDRPTAIGSIKMGLMNPENEDDLVVVEIPEQLSIDFGELSEVYVFGKTRRSMYRDQETHKLVDGDVIIQATGIFTVVPTPKESGYTEMADETPVNGWLD